MNTVLISSAVSIVLYVFFFAGIIFFEYDEILIFIQRYKLLRKKEKPMQGRLEILCGNLLSSALGKDIDGMWLIIAEAWIFLISFFVAIRNFSFGVSAAIALFCALLPLLLLYSKMQSLRSRGSKEGISLLTELYRQYKMNSLNIYKAIELTIAAGGDYPVCRKHLYVLLIRLRDASGGGDIKSHCSALSFALGGNWGRSLASCIEIAAAKGTDISLALLDILEQLKLAKRLAEERKRLNGESMRMTLFLVPFMYVMTVFVSMKYLDLSLAKFLSNQFFTPKGLLLFIVNLCLFVINMCFMNIVTDSGMDF